MRRVNGPWLSRTCWLSKRSFRKLAFGRNQAPTRWASKVNPKCTMLATSPSSIPKTQASQKIVQSPIMSVMELSTGAIFTEVRQMRQGKMRLPGAGMIRVHTRRTGIGKIQQHISWVPIVLPKMRHCGATGSTLPKMRQAGQTGKISWEMFFIQATAMILDQSQKMPASRKQMHMAKAQTLQRMTLSRKQMQMVKTQSLRITVAQWQKC